MPELAVRKRRLSWVLTLFSSLVLFTGTFTLSSDMEWSRNHYSIRGPLGTGRLVEEDGSQAWSWQPPLSLRAFPRESSLATMYSAYFVSYLICDLVLGMMHYRAHIDPLSGWCHHLGYLAVVSNATMQKNVSTLFAMGTPIEGRHRCFLYSPSIYFTPFLCEVYSFILFSPSRSFDYFLGFWPHLSKAPLRFLVCDILLPESHRVSRGPPPRVILERGLETVLEGRVDGPDGPRALVQEICSTATSLLPCPSCAFDGERAPTNDPQLSNRVAPGRKIIHYHYN